MAAIEFRPVSEMGKQALKAFEVIINSNNQSDIVRAGQRLLEIVANGAQINSSERSKLHSELSYHASIGGLGSGYLDELRLEILSKAFYKLDSTY